MRDSGVAVGAHAFMRGNSAAFLSLAGFSPGDWQPALKRPDGNRRSPPHECGGSHRTNAKLLGSVQKLLDQLLEDLMHGAEAARPHKCRNYQASRDQRDITRDLHQGGKRLLGILLLAQKTVDADR